MKNKYRTESLSTDSVQEAFKKYATKSKEKAAKDEANNLRFTQLAQADTIIVNQMKEIDEKELLSRMSNSLETQEKFINEL